MTVPLVQLVEEGHYFFAYDWDETEVDIFRHSQGYCNGPECAICKESMCHHCYPDFETSACRTLEPVMFEVTIPVTRKWKNA